MKFIICIFLLTHNILAFQCPKESYKVELDSEFEDKKKLICYKKSGSGRVKHGPEKHINAKGQTLYKSYYIDGKESTKKSKNTDVQTSTNSYTEASKIISRLLNSTTYSKKTSFETSSFTTKKCKGDKNDWMKLFLLDKGFTHTYEFTKFCDLKGSWSPRIGEKFKADFKIKDVKDFNRVQMDLLFTTKKSFLSPSLTIDITDGTISSPNHKFKFHGNYKGIIDSKESMTQQILLFQEQKGELTFTEHNGKKINVKKELELEMK